MVEFSENTALIIVDVQQGFDLDPDYFGTNRNNPQAESNMARLLNAWRVTKRPIFHVKHNSINVNSPLRPNHAGNQIKPEVQPLDSEPLFEKTVNSAFIGTDLEAQLREKNIEQVVIVGLVTNHCISTTVRMSGNLGFETYLISDATAAFDLKGLDGTLYPAQLVHDTSLASLNGEFATIFDTDEALKFLSIEA